MPHPRCHPQVMHDGLPFRAVRTDPASAIKDMDRGVGDFVCNGFREMRIPVAYKSLGIETDGWMAAVDPELTGGAAAQIKKNRRGGRRRVAGGLDIKGTRASANTVAGFRVEIHAMFWFCAGFRGIFVKRWIERNILCLWPAPVCKSSGAGRERNEQWRKV